MAEKIIVDRKGISLEKITEGDILVFSGGREERVKEIFKMPGKIHTIHTERTRKLEESEVLVRDQVEYDIPLGEKLYPWSWGYIFKYKKIYPNKEDCFSGAGNGS